MDARAAEQVWHAALGRLQHRMSPSAYTTWFAGSRALTLDGNLLTVAFPSDAATEQVERRFKDLARIAVSEALGRSALLSCVVQPGTAATTAVPLFTPSRTRGRTPAANEPLPTAPRAASNADTQTAASGSSRKAYTRAAQAPSASVRVASERQRGGTRAPRAAQPPLLSEASEPLHATVPLDDGRLDGARRVSPPVATPASLTPSSGSHAIEPKDAHELNTRYTFDTFVVGDANRLAYTAAQEVAQAPGQRYNPLLLYGGVGLGKTHLLHAIGHVARASRLRVAYVTAEQFTNEIVEAIRQRTTDVFRMRYREVDVLLVDDVQFIAGKGATEEEFFHTFNALHDVDKQIILSSDRIPRAMSHLHDRLRSRFEWGLMADVQLPDFEHRLEILRAKATTVAMSVPEDVIVCLARPQCESIRALEGTLNRVVAYANMVKQPLDLRLVALAQKSIGSEFGMAAAPIDCASVLAAVARHFQVSIADLQGKTREQSIAWARQVAMYLLREETPTSLPRIGQQLGGRDHTTIMHGCARVGKALAQDERARHEIAAIRVALRS